MTPPIDGSARKTFAVGLLFLFLAGSGYLLLRDSQAMYSNTPMRGDPGPFFLSSLCLGCLALAGGILSLMGLLGLRDQGASLLPTHQFIEGVRSWGLPIGFVASLLAMPRAIEGLGTMLAVVLFSSIWIYVLLSALRGHAVRHAVEALIFGAGAALFIQLIFVRLLTLPLPA